MFVLAGENERRVIDAMRPQTDYVSPEVTQADLPGHDPSGIGGDKGYNLPDPSVGGQNASGKQNGFSTGFRSMFTRLQSFRGAVAKPPAVHNPVQGEVGMNNRQAALYAGVMSQNATYAPATSQYNAIWVGPDGI